MKQSTSFAQVATNLLNVLQGYTKGIRFLLVMFLTLTVSAAWAETTTYTVSASSGKLSNWTGTVGSAYADGSVKFGNSGNNYANAAIWSGEVSTGMTELAVTISYKLNGTSSSQNVFTVSVVNSSGSAIVSKTFAPTSTSKTDVTLTFDNLSGSPTGLQMVYTTKESGNVGVYEVSATATYSTTPSCTDPTISTQPTGATYTKDDSPTTLSVVASGDDLTYQWYSNTSNSTSGATKISGATSSTYTPSTSMVGTKYYYCIVSSGSCSTTSNIVSVVVKNPTYTVIWKSNGVEIRTDNNVESGTNKTAPTISPIPCGDVIAGWTDAENYVHGTSTLYSGATPSIQITGNKTFYAVFADYAD
jgi:hypothetical protein